MIPIPEFITLIFGENAVQQWLTALITMGIVAAVLFFIRSVLVRKFTQLAVRTASQIDDVLAEAFSKTRFLFVVLVALWTGAQSLSLPENVDSILDGGLLVVVLFQAGLWVNGIVVHIVHHFVSMEIKDDSSRIATTTVLTFVGKLVLWSIVLLLALDNLGIDINALIASLGVGGIAIALAAQNILGDLFASLSIMFDKPFVVGDFIVLDTLMGTVENIGLKTTHVRSSTGEQLIISNNDLLKSRIKNYKRMEERRITFTLGITYQTSADKLEKIPQIIKEILDDEEEVRFDRSHFKTYGDFSLIFETVYWVKKPDYAVFMDIQQRVNLAIYRKFEEEGIEFAYPTQTIHIDEQKPSPTLG